MAADLPENYEHQPAFQFIRDVAVDWDTTRVLAGKIGDYVVISCFFSSRRRHTIFDCDWSSDVCSSDLFQMLRIARTRAERETIQRVQCLLFRCHLRNGSNGRRLQLLFLRVETRGQRDEEKQIGRASCRERV